MGKTNLHWVAQKVFIGTDTNGHSIVIGRNSEGENPWRGVKPSDLLLLAVASCSAYDVVEILTKQKEPFSGLRVETTGEQMNTPPYAFTRIHNRYVVNGSVDPKKLEKAIHLSEEKYCSVINSLNPQIELTNDYEIIQQ